MIREQVPLAPYTTLRLGGPAARFVRADHDDQVIEAVQDAERRGDPVLILGGGSNLVVADEGFPGTVIQLATRGITIQPTPAQAVPAQPGTGQRGEAAPEQFVTVQVAAGEDWDTVVRWSIASGLSGVECLSGIPGQAGATPIQNVGAYGQEVAATITAVQAYDRHRGELTELANADCGFGYRTSLFKHSMAGRFVVLGVTFRLARDPLSVPVRYAELAATLGFAEGERVPLAAARAAVLRLRRGKGMVLDPADPDTRSAGSFFTNPVLDQAQVAALEAAVAGGWPPGTAVPRFPAGNGQFRVPAGWLIEHAGFGKGYPGNGPAGPRISAKHTLALVNPGEATTASLLNLAREIRDGVQDTFGIALTQEPVLVGAVL
ncbi:MAG: UDP-N-acetylmuramate dehydrogenase [Actinomycetota bacterium]